MIFRLLLVLAVASPQPVAEEKKPETPQALAKRILSSSRYEFCHDPHYVLRKREEKWCSLVDEKSDVCPALAAACKSPKRRADDELFAWNSQGSTPSKSDPVLDPAKPFSFHLPKLDGLAKVLLWALLGAIVAAIGYAIFKAVRDRDKSGKIAPTEEIDESAADVAVEMTRQAIEVDVDRLLARADEKSKTGDYPGAMHDVYAALLRRLEGNELIVVDPSRTNGDYVRSLGSQPELCGRVAEIARELEHVQFGSLQATHPRFDSFRRAVLPLVGRAATVLALAMLVACGSGGGGGCFRSSVGSWDHAPHGHAALIELLIDQKLNPKTRLLPLSDPGPTDKVIVLLPAAVVDQSAMKKLIDWANAGGRLVIIERSVSELGFELTTSSDLTWSQRTVRSPSHLHFKETKPLPNQWTEEVKTPDGKLFSFAQGPVGQGRITLFADGDFLCNGGLALHETAAYVAHFFSQGVEDNRSKPIEFVTEFVGRDAPNPVTSVRRSKLLPALLQLFALIAVFFLGRGIAFGTLRDPVSRLRRSFAEHARALASTLRRASAFDHSLALYATFVIERLREKVHSQTPGLTGLAESVALRAGRPVGEVMRVLLDAQLLREGSPLKETATQDGAELASKLELYLSKVGGPL